MLNSTFNGVTVNDIDFAKEIKAYIKTIAPEQEKIVKYYSGKEPIFEKFGVDKQIKSLFGKYVTMKSRAYLVIEHTEALHVIDVNSGSRSNSKEDQESNALGVNLDAAEEIALQLRLRDMGGIIVVDFIDLYQAGNRKKLYEKLKEAMDKDRAKHKILPPSRFGLIQITRQRVRPEMNIVTDEQCPSCNGSGEIQASVLLIDELEKNLSYFLKEQNESGITMRVHPFIEAYLTKGMLSIKRKWLLKYTKPIRVIADASYHIIESHFFNREDEEIKI
jgi:ribonuclease G